MGNLKKTEEGKDMAQKGKRANFSTKCYNCGSSMEDAVELVIVKGKSIPQQIKKCNKCGRGIVNINEYERVRRDLHPNIFTRIKNCFKVDTEVVELFKGRVL